MTALLDNLINPMSQWYRDSSIRAFMQWWSGELIRMVPEKYRDSIFPEAQAVYINQGDREKPMLWRYQNNQFTPLDEDTDLQNDEWWHRINHFIAESEVNISTTYLLSNQYAIVRNVTLPQAAMGEIDSVLAYELDKYVPFRADEAVFAWRQGPVDDGSEKVLILLAVIKKDILDNILQAINSKGVKLSGIDINVGSDEAPQPLGVNLLPVEMRKKKDWSKWKLYGGLGLALLLLLSLVMFNSLDNKRSKIENLNEQVELLRKDARRAKLLENQLNQSITAANFLGNLKQQIPSRVLMIHELNEKIPNNTYLSRIIIDNERMEIVGQSDNANALVPILNDSDTWYEPKIVGNVRPDPRSGKEQFTIKAELQAQSAAEVDNGA
ncbi:type II secretion system protein L [Marinicella pacifica]|uniref:Type II secretion system protein L n=1 Tax=Marinicella pacifica TaxID=1171543 RepID=A0A917FP50_9GAMM|nr:PilN domain-containing protein [Marinicella pacifica]GGF92173.1 type II secretion system protein L [Marinicella pacifica]